MQEEKKLSIDSPQKDEDWSPRLKKDSWGGKGSKKREALERTQEGPGSSNNAGSNVEERRRLL